jgi:hypothetical protein
MSQDWRDKRGRLKKSPTPMPAEPAPGSTLSCGTPTLRPVCPPTWGNGLKPRDRQQIRAPARAGMVRDQGVIKRRHLVDAIRRQGAAFPQKLSGVGADIMKAGETAALPKIGISTRPRASMAAYYWPSGLLGSVEAAARVD